MKGFDLAAKYKIAIMNFPYGEECPEFCHCGHHASEHFGQGSNGGCRGCGHDKPMYIQFGNNQRVQVPRQFCHNFYPSPTNSGGKEKS